MSDDTERRIDMTRLAKGRYEAVNARGGRLELGTGTETGEAFTPVELLLVAIAGCTAADVDFIVSKRAEPDGFHVTMTGEKVRDDGGNRMTNLRLGFELRFPEDEGGAAARAVLPEAVRRSHDRLCTVSRTVELGTEIEVEVS
jgi:uncharacterized OsmC-like protein